MISLSLLIYLSHLSNLISHFIYHLIYWSISLSSYLSVYLGARSWVYIHILYVSYHAPHCAPHCWCGGRMAWRTWELYGWLSWAIIYLNDKKGWEPYVSWVHFSEECSRTWLSERSVQKVYNRLGKHESDIISQWVTISANYLCQRRRALMRGIKEPWHSVLWMVGPWPCSVPGCLALYVACTPNLPDVPDATLWGLD